MLHKYIHKDLRDLRIDAGLSQAELAERLGSKYSEKVVSEIESGTRPVSIRVLDRWADICGYVAAVNYYKRT